MVGVGVVVVVVGVVVVAAAAVVRGDKGEGGRVVKVVEW